MFNVVFLTEDGKSSNYSFKSITLPTSDGKRTILSRHSECFIEVDFGVVECKNDKEVKKFSVSQGVFHFKDNVGELMVSTYESEDEIDLERALKAKERAVYELENQKDFEEMRKAEQALKRAIARLKLK